jgi:hypothetical protein
MNFTTLTVANMLAVDPGTSQSGWVLFDGQRVLDSGVMPNPEVVRLIRAHADGCTGTLAIERFEARGMPMGEDSIETVIWTGRFVQAWRDPDAVRLVKRREVKSHLCGTSKAKDPHVRQALLDTVGPVGKKAAPGPCYGVTSHAWAALAVAVTARAQMEGRA